MTATTERRRVALALAALVFAAAFGLTSVARGAPAKLAAIREGATISSAPPLSGNAVAIDSSGRIVVAGGGADPAAIAVARYEPDGSLDKSFGTNGKATTEFPTGEASANAVAIDPAGRIVVAGYYSSNSGTDVNDIALARFNADGSLDKSFGTDGQVTTSFSNDVARAVAIDSSGRIVVAGGDCSPPSNLCVLSFVVARYNPDGTLDPSFGDGGERLFSVDGCTNGVLTGSSAFAVAIDPSGRIVLAGHCNDSGFALARLTPTGADDPTFGSGGGVTTDFGGTGLTVATGVSIDASGRIVAAGG